MDYVMRAGQPDSICEGCLSHDRTLSIITNDEVKKVYCTIIHEKLCATYPLTLCWECTANIKRYILFQRQCAHAYESLLKHKVTPRKLTTLSKLSIAKNNIKINIFHTHEEAHNGVHLTPKYEESETHGVDMTPSYQNLTESNNSDIGLIKTHGRGRDIHFIKIEEDAVLDDTVGYYMDDGIDQQGDIDDKELTAVFKSDHEEKTSISKTEDDFNDSDEEPLNNKRRNKTVRGRKHKRSKEKGIPKNNDVKLTRRKREKPAGVVSNPRVNKKLQQLNVGEGQLEMVVLTWEEVEEERQRALSSVVFTRHEYRCHYCIVGFNHKFKLDNHMKKHDPSSGSLVCDVCQVRCRNSHALCAHRRRHRVRWRCCVCGSSASRASVAADHVARAHGGPPPAHACAVCGHCETTLGKLRNHLKNHAERQKCELCGKTFRDRTSLRTHLFIHKGEKEYSCPRCDKKFLFKKAMEVHMVTHDAPAHLYCYQCDMNFKNRMSYTQHMKYSLKHIDPAKLKYACQLCDKKFVKATRLHEHNLAVHLKVTPIRCTVPACNFACSSRPVLRTHTRMVHRNAKALRNHVCDTCGKTYTTKKTLEGHMRSHTGERPFTCALCPSTFGYEAALYNHNKLVHLKAKMCRRSTHTPLPLQLPVPQPDLT